MYTLVRRGPVRDNSQSTLGNHFAFKFKAEVSINKYDTLALSAPIVAYIDFDNKVESMYRASPE